MERDMRLFLASLAATVAMTLFAIAFPNLTRIITVPAALACLGLTVFCLLPELRNFHNGRKNKILPFVGMALCALGFVGFFCLYFYSSTSQLFTADITSLNIIGGGPGQNRVDFVVFVHAASEQDGITPSNWRLTVKISGGPSYDLDAIPVVDPITYNMANGAALSLLPDASLVGKTEMSYTRGDSYGRLLFSLFNVPYSMAANMANQLTLSVDVNGKNIVSPTIVISSLAVTNPPTSPPQAPALQ